MSMIVHRCATCGHSNHEHHIGGVCGCARHSQGCHAGNHKPDYGTPEIVPTFDGRGQVVARLLGPGEALRTEAGAAIVVTCSCDDCCALYAESSAVSA